MREVRPVAAWRGAAIFLGLVVVSQYVALGFAGWLLREQSKLNGELGKRVFELHLRVRRLEKAR